MIGVSAESESHFGTNLKVLTRIYLAIIATIVFQWLVKVVILGAMYEICIKDCTVPNDR